MAKTVWKFELDSKDVNEFEIPKGGKVLSLQLQHGSPCIWVLVDDELEKEKRRFGIVGTGHFIKQKNIEYIGTFQQSQGYLVFHCFEFFL
ncbi:hypothetical protein [Flavobacterium sp.]|jgi:hypothetical protein|uniref:DUF7352 domain-containing protein n=1 Tax=Flavobacterium sp. TaxID=239 RepID=UPI0037C08A70